MSIEFYHLSFAVENDFEYFELFIFKFSAIGLVVSSTVSVEDPENLRVILTLKI